MSNDTKTPINGLTVELGEDYSDLRDAVRKLCEGFPGEYWRGLEKTDEYPTEFIKALTEAGFLAALIPEEYGGSGLPLRAAAIILEEINASGCVASQGHAQMYIMGALLRHGSEEQKQKYLPGIASGELRLQAFGVTEPTSGTDTTSLKTTAVRQGDKYIVNGQKVFISRALHSDLMLLLARTTPLKDVQKKTDGMSIFLVDIRENLGKGIEIRHIDSMINHGATEIFFDNLAVPAENLIGVEGRGFHYILDGMNAERILVGTEAVGDARYCLKKAVDYANERKVFGRTIGKNQGVQFPLARVHIDIEVADQMCRKAAAQFTAGAECGEAANVAKLLASEVAFKAADVAMQTMGGFSFAREYDIERKWRETRLYQIAPISTNLILSFVGQHVLGLERSF
jgi:acyl-CoA dehydrogenase